MAAIAATIAATIWAAFWAVIIISTGTQGLVVMAVIHLMLIFCFCLAYALVYWDG